MRPRKVVLVISADAARREQVSYALWVRCGVRHVGLVQPVQAESAAQARGWLAAAVETESPPACVLLLRSRHETPAELLELAALGRLPLAGTPSLEVMYGFREPVLEPATRRLYGPVEMEQIAEAVRELCARRAPRAAQDAKRRRVA